MQTEANRVTWAKIKEKLADVLKAFGENIDAAVLSAFGKTINTDADENNAMAGSLAFTSSELTIATGSVTATRTHHSIDTEADAASDNLDNIGTGSVSDGATLFLRCVNASRVVTIRHEQGGAGQFHLIGGNDIVLDDLDLVIAFIRNGADWYEVGRPFNVSVAKAWVRFAVTGSIEASYNIASMDDDGPGDFGFHFTTAFADANYIAVGSSRTNPGTSSTITFDNQLAASIEITTMNSGGTASETNVEGGSLVFFGEQ